MRSWPIQQARDHLRDLFDAAITDGPQRITRHGKQGVVVVSETEWRRLCGEDRDFGAFLAACPGAELPPRRPARAIRDDMFD